jgi:hypothetical protein
MEMGLRSPAKRFASIWAKGPSCCRPRIQWRRTRGGLSSMSGSIIYRPMTNVKILWMGAGGGSIILDQCHRLDMLSSSYENLRKWMFSYVVA